MRTAPLPPLQTRAELNAKLDGVRRIHTYIYYAVVVVLTLVNFWNIFLAIPLWFVHAYIYTWVDNYYEAQYLNAILERKRDLTTK